MHSEQNTTKPLTAEEEIQFRAYVDLTGHRAVSRALDHIDASRAESAQLRESLAAAEKARDALAAELAEARKRLRTVHIELAALVVDPQNPDWRLFHPDIREADAKCLTDAYDAARDSGKASGGGEE